MYLVCAYMFCIVLLVMYACICIRSLVGPYSGYRFTVSHCSSFAGINLHLFFFNHSVHCGFLFRG